MIVMFSLCQRPRVCAFALYGKSLSNLHRIFSGCVADCACFVVFRGEIAALKMATEWPGLIAGRLIGTKTSGLAMTSGFVVAGVLRQGSVGVGPFLRCLGSRQGLLLCGEKPTTCACL